MNAFYHGTTDLFDIKNVLLPPIITNNKREYWRKYAKKACSQFGGNPIVYIVKPIGHTFNNANNEFVSDKALIIDVIR